MNENITIASFVENQAIQYLENKDYIIKAKNFKCFEGQIDIVATKDNEIIFCEVNNYNKAKQTQQEKGKRGSHIWEAAEFYLYKNNLINSYIRFDVLELLVEGTKIEIKKIKNVFS